MGIARDICVRTVAPSADDGAFADRLPCVEEIDFNILGPAREPRDEAALLLAVGAEVEHALMVQYLYAAYSIRRDQPNHELRGRVDGVASRLIQIAREEMGHFITVQNLLRLIGAPLHFERQGSPFESALYPFRFKLERLSRSSLAKYVTAESPGMRPPEMPEKEWEDARRIACEAQVANDGQPLRHVGELYARLVMLFQDPEKGLKDNDFITENALPQALEEDWGLDVDRLRSAGDVNREVQVSSFTQDNPTAQRQLAVAALQQLAEQGEGFGSMVDSHFSRFLELYKDFGELSDDGVQFVWPVANNPTIIPTQLPSDWDNCSMAEAARTAFKTGGYIGNERSRGWAALFNARYRLLLAFLSHFLHLPGERYVEPKEEGAPVPPEAIGDATPRGLLLIWTFDEMRRVKKIAEKLSTMPLNSPDDGRTSGAPFQLPYSMEVSGREADRWRAHLDVTRQAIRLIGSLRAGGGSTDADDPFLADVLVADVERERILLALAGGQAIPDGSLPRDFRKVVTILEQSVRGFSINVHGNFWAKRTREEFVGQHIFNSPLFGRDANDGCRLSPRRSALLGVISRQGTGRMPQYRPAIPESRLRFISDWITAQAPDSKPEGQIGIKTEASPSKEPDPPAALVAVAAARRGSLSYEADIRPLFRDFDRAFLKSLAGIDIDNIKSVRRRSGFLAKQLSLGRLPYDASWPEEHIDRFARWVKDGKMD